MRRLGGVCYVSRLGKFQRQPTEDGQVGAEANPLDAANAEHRQTVVVLQAAKLALNCGAAAVEAAPLVATTRNEQADDPGRASGLVACCS